MKKRIISAIVALAIVTPLIILGGNYFAFLAGALSVLAYKELLDLKENAEEIPNIVKGLGLVSLVTLIFSEFDSQFALFGISYRILAISLLALLIPTLFYKDNKYTTREAFYIVGIVLFLSIVFNNFILIRNESVHKLVYLILICSCTDAFAMFTGMLIGKHKITPNISPKKTVEGCIGGSIIGSCIPIIYYVYFISGFTWKLLLITVLLSVIDQFGDLFFSKIKRENKIKDFSNIMPGHGGILDRLDSLCFVVITYIIFISYI
ncbi:MAG: phosphatidate cytidylyltransferase [Bacilli bacterium]|nr:phosphatidate cytidylyltransferase [Bacilli bacterium]